jgi:arabinan endo-1,5-alpha-L-arabinosidase
MGGAGGGGVVPLTYQNPITASNGAADPAINCPDPTVIYAPAPGDEAWYIFCTADPLNDKDKDAGGKYKQNLIATLKSKDLVSFTYVGNALSALPSYAKPDADLWAPEVHSLNGKYYLYFTVNEVAEGGTAIGVATSDSPAGPWKVEEEPVVEAHPAPCCAGSKRWVFDAYVIEEGAKKYIYYGSYFGGISVRELSADGFVSDPTTQQDIVIPDRYEGAVIRKRDDYYYFFGSASNCCNGPLTGYSAFVGRSKSPFGPFIDRDGVSLGVSRVGGTPVLQQNGNRWIGSGHNAIVTDFGGQDWVFYHAIDKDDPYLDPSSDPGFDEKRHVLMDPLDWIDGWPIVRGGRGPSDEPMPAPAAQPGQVSGYTVDPFVIDAPGDLLADHSEEFDGMALDATKWTWVREPPAGAFELSNGSFRYDVEAGDLYVDLNSASVLHRAAPAGDYIAEVKLTLSLPVQGCCFNFAQGGLVIYGDDDNYVRLMSVSIWETRQIEFAKEIFPVPDGYPRFGSGVLGPYAETIFLRIVKRAKEGGGEVYTSYSSIDGETWRRGEAWTHNLGPGARIAIASMGRGVDVSDFTTYFDYVRVYSLKN